jgi:geranylgeranyl diphosphate synthase, type I
MNNNGEFSVENLPALIKNRGLKVLREFGQVAVSGVSDPKFLSVLRYVKAYWPDTFRPALTSLCCEAVGGEPEAADDVSLMITLASAGGGIHDDIIDKSLSKHFRMTVLGLHGSDYALLAGDLLIIKGWALAQEVAKTCSPEKMTKVIEIFGRWTLDVCEAEFMEISCRRNLDIEIDYYQTILRQSMADVKGCARLGAVIGGGGTNEIEALSDFGSSLGFMYRLEDDVKDTLNMEFNLCERLKNESVPLPILFAAKSSKARYAQIRSIIENSRIGSQCIEELADLCSETGAFSYVLSTVKENASLALEKLGLLKPSDARSVLELMVEKSLADVSKLCS